MNPLLHEALYALVRRGLLIVATWIAANTGAWTQSEATSYAEAATLAAISIGWSYYVKRAGRIKLVTALGVARVSEAELEAHIAEGGGSPVTTPKDQIPIPIPKTAGEAGAR